MQQEAANELVGIQAHDLHCTAMAVVPPTECDLIALHADKAGIGDRDAVGIACEIGQDLLRAPKRRLGIDDPLDAPAFGKHAFEVCEL